MSLTLGKSFNRQYKLRLPFKDFFYDVGIFFHTDINFNLFDINAVLKYNSDQEFTGNQINMYKNIEMSDFCKNCLDLHLVDNRPAKFNNILDEWKDDVYLETKEKIFINANNFMKIFIFKLKNYDNKKDDFLFLLVERKNFLKKYRSDKIITTLSGLQIATQPAIEYIAGNTNKEKIILSSSRNTNSENIVFNMEIEQDVKSND